LDCGEARPAEAERAADRLLAAEPADRGRGSAAGNHRQARALAEPLRARGPAVAALRPRRADQARRPAAAQALLPAQSCGCGGVRRRARLTRTLLARLSRQLRGA